MKPADIVRAYDARVKERKAIEEVWNLIERFIRPFGGGFNQTGRIDWKKREVFDSTGIDANQLLASNIQSSLTNPVTKWARYSFSNLALQRNPEALAWLQDSEDRVMTSIRSSNFNNEAGDFYLDLTSFSAGVQTQEVEEDDSGGLEKVLFDSIPPGECCFDLDLAGLPRNFYRELNWTALQIVDKFGEENVPEVIKRDAERPEGSYKKHKLLFCVWLRPENKNVDTYGVLAPEKRPYGAQYVHYDSKKAIGKEIGYYEMPVHMAQWRSVSGSDWGFSPAMIAIWDVLTLNQVKELILIAGEKAIDPSIMTTNRGVFGEIDLGAGGVTVVTDLKAVEAFESKARFDVSQLNVSELKESIREQFFWDQLQLKDSPAMTAYEVQARIQLMQRLIGPTYGRLQSHYLDTLLERHFKILYRYGKLARFPQSVMEEKESDIVINYSGPLASAQRMDEVQTIESTLQTIGGVGQVYPEALDNIDPDFVVKEIIRAKGAPSRILKDSTQVKKQRKDREEQARQAAELEQTRQTGEAMQAVGQGKQVMNEA